MAGKGYQVVRKECKVQLSGGDVKVLPAGATVKYIDSKWFSNWKSHPFHDLERRSNFVIISCQFGLAMIHPDELEWDPIS